MGEIKIEVCRIGFNYDGDLLLDADSEIIDNMTEKEMEKVSDLSYQIVELLSGVLKRL